MRKKVFYLGTCNTCTRIMKEAGVDESFEQQEIRQQPVSAPQLDEMHQMAESYESLFNRRSRQYAALGLKERRLAEDDYRQLILNEPTFLKRPVFLIGDSIFIGNAKGTVQSLLQALKDA